LRGRLELPTSLGLNAVATHETSNPMAPGLYTLGSQGRMNTRTPIGWATLCMRDCHERQKLLIGFGASRQGSIQPSSKAGLGDRKAATHKAHGKAGDILGPGLIPHDRTERKNAPARSASCDRANNPSPAASAHTHGASGQAHCRRPFGPRPSYPWHWLSSERLPIRTASFLRSRG